MAGYCKDAHDKVAGETYGGNATAPLNELQNSQSVLRFGNTLTRDLGMDLKITEPSPAQTGPRNDPGFHA